MSSWASRKMEIFCISLILASFFSHLLITIENGGEAPMFALKHLTVQLDRKQNTLQTTCVQIQNKHESEWL
jgi:hypothetical protein